MFNEKNSLEKYHIITFGCQMNENDSEIISGLLESQGFSFCPDYREADIIVINTCAVRKKAEDKVTGLLGELIDWKSGKKGRVLCVGGCMSQQEEIASYLKKKFKHIDVIFGTHSMPKLPEMIEKSRFSKETILDINEDFIRREKLPLKRKKSYHSWVPIIYGCNNFCSYCVVPYVRGREKSRPFPDIMEEVEKLARDGCKEIMLLGQNVNAYGKDLPEKKSLFSLLLNELDKIDGIERIRFLTSHPRDFDEEMVKAIAATRKVCEHFHLPIQSGSNRILKKMNRGYTRERYIELTEIIKKYIPGAAITSDIIVGFPGEKTKDFQDTIDLLEKVKLDAAYTFVYSERKNTPAAEMPNKVSPEEIKERITTLIHKQQEIGFEVNQKYAGKKVEVLVEGKSKTDKDKYSGRTRTNKLVHFKGKNLKEGDIRILEITEAKTWHLAGKLTNC